MHTHTTRHTVHHRHTSHTAGHQCINCKKQFWEETIRIFSLCMNSFVVMSQKWTKTRVQSIFQQTDSSLGQSSSLIVWLDCNDVYVTQIADKSQVHPFLHSFKSSVDKMYIICTCACVLSLPSSTLASAQPTSPTLWHLTGNFEDPGCFLCDSRPNVP